MTEELTNYQKMSRFHARKEKYMREQGLKMLAARDKAAHEINMSGPHAHNLHKVFLAIRKKTKNAEKAQLIELMNNDAPSRVVKKFRERGLIKFNKKRPSKRKAKKANREFRCIYARFEGSRVDTESFSNPYGCHLWIEASIEDAVSGKISKRIDGKFILYGSVGPLALDKDVYFPFNNQRIVLLFSYGNVPFRRISGEDLINTRSLDDLIKRCSTGPFLDLTGDMTGEWKTIANNGE